MDFEKLIDEYEPSHRGRIFKKKKTKWTFFVYMAADNDLYPFASRNLAQMKQIGSNENLNIAVHLDIHQPGQPKMTKRLSIEKDKILQIGPDFCMDSGKAETFIDATSWALDRFPSEHLAIVLWNHGSGDLNPTLRKTINPSQLYRYNPENHLIELDRSIGFMDFIDHLAQEEDGKKVPKRGICFDETNGSYLDDAKLMRAFNHIIQKRNGQKIDIVIFDACLMAGTGTAFIISQFADYMVASEEVVLGPGYNYSIVLEPLAELQKVVPREFAQHIVECYHATYGKITQDYTHSAFDLAAFDALNNNIDRLSNLLIQALKAQVNGSVAVAIKESRSRNQCTYFDEPSYIDLFNFYKNLLQRINQISLSRAQDHIKEQLRKVINDGIKLIGDLVIANAAGKNLSGAGGISIYFPEYKMHGKTHESFNYTEFGRNNKWRQFLDNYLR